MVAAGIVAYYFLFNASFYWWKAGMTFGPRYAGACIPLFCVGLAMAWERASLVWRRGLIVLAVGSVFVALMVISTTSQLSTQDSCPLVYSTWQEFWSGHLAVNRDSMLTVAEAGSGGDHGAFNLGQLVGLHGLGSLIPLIVVWGVAAGLWWRVQRVSAEVARALRVR
jgi:cytochrome c oxidase subunit IV